MTADAMPSDHVMPSDMLPTSEAAAYMGVTDRHFRRRYARRLQAVEGAHGTLFYRRSDLDHVRDVQVRSDDVGGQVAGPDAMTRQEHNDVRALQSEQLQALIEQIATAIAAPWVERAEQLAGDVARERLLREQAAAAAIAAQERAEAAETQAAKIDALAKRMADALQEARRERDVATAAATQAGELTRQKQAEVERLGQLAEERKAALDQIVAQEVEQMEHPRRRRWWPFG